MLLSISTIGGFLIENSYSQQESNDKLINAVFEDAHDNCNLSTHHYSETTIRTI